MKNRIVTAIDVGTTKICTIIAEVNPVGGVNVVGVGIGPSQGLHKGLVVNINDARESIRESIRKAEQASGYKVESAYVGVTGRHVASMNNRGVVAITRNDRLVRSDDLKRVMATAQNISVPNDRKLLHVIPRTYAVDGQSGVKNPVGMHGFRLDVETHIITAAATSVQNLVKCIRGLGIDIDDLVLEPIASSEAVLTEDEKQVGVILADIGGGTTDICIFKDGSIWHTAIIPVAGYQLTRDVAIGLGLPFDVAEEMKKRYGSVLPVYETKMESPSPICEDGHGVSYQDLCDIIRARVEEVLRLIMLEIPNSDYDSLVPAGLVLTGGSSNLAGMETLGRDILRIPVRVGNPDKVYGIVDSLHDPAYATGVGLLIWGAKHQPVKKSWLDNIGFFGRMRNLLKGFAGLFGSN
ncbi:MAG: cell division protein FtsA [Dehalococcoides mccartyi]|jgi:cell division protein FtsA|uniref:Cell division protein FtsA n=3 Tax=root TaxID=1 RepID=A0A0V8M4Z9_9CHLR|nr:MULTISPECIES: cell division protein FtsA [Dehalococcoides]AAW40413.1 cell division protein FtsA [Dehalococcoides mccartyi 195]AII59037.1 cell division protein FtsA [Dehalococcoides mccartyi CG4]KSV18838.1 cell division protein FtsA [Dehalococcoides mccartyi]MBF4482508.1 cell division protein FtsA [Dehalococcoides mccartyi]MBJ7532493.1 cell division protein FtsA [Dehalococcoides mccartyi]